MTRHSIPSFSLCEIAGAVAEAAIHDLRVNLFCFSGFPQINVTRLAEGAFDVALSWAAYETQFQLSDAEANVAVRKFKSDNGFENSIFDKVQKALASLEGKVLAGRRAPHA